MKSRTLKLREAHKGGSAVAFCSILWDEKADHFVTSSSSDPSISIHDGLSTSTTALRHHRDGVTALALSHNSTCLASGSIDNCVKLYKFPSGEFQTNITRFILPIRALAFNRSGSLLAAAGDDNGIKLINTIDGSIAKLLKGHEGTVTGLDFDPNGELLASLDSTGSVLCWELPNGTVSFTLKRRAPDTGFDSSIANVLRWSPNGRTLAVPGLNNDVVMYDRFTGEKLFSLRGEHVEPICYLAWAPNGKYIATSGLDKQVLIWDIDKKQDIDRQKFEQRISCMAWKPNGNALSVIDVNGRYGIWESVIPSSMTSPTVDIPNISNKSNGLLFFDDKIGEELSAQSGSLNDPSVDSDGGESHHTSSRKRLRKKTFVDDDGYANEDFDDGNSLPSASEYKKKAHREKQRAGSGSLKKCNAGSTKYKMQSPFQPGATPQERGKRTFLCYNMLGCITTIEHEGNNRIETDFHDTGRGPRVSSMIDIYGFTMASINENGCVFANPCKGDKNMSVLMYRPFRSWASNSEWTMRFEGEEVKVVANGSGWVAAITSLNHLRIFSEGGLQKHIISLDGPVVTAVGCKDQLAVITHVSDCLPSNEQVMKFKVFNISRMTQQLKGRVALTPGSRLTWVGFSEEGALSTYDSEGVLRVFTSQYGGSWIPVFSKEKKPEENYWVVGLNATSIYCIACKYPERYPQVTPKPILTILDLSLPLASSDLGAASLENEFVLKQLRFFETEKKVEEMASSGVDTTAVEDEAFDLEVSQDKCILRLISSCCSSDKFVRAGELMRLLSLEKSMRAAITLVTKLKLPFLAEKFSTILEERLLEEANEAIANQSREVVTRVESKVQNQNPPASIKASENIAATKLSATTLGSKAKVSEGLKLGKEEMKRGETQDAKKKEIKDLNLVKNRLNNQDKGLRKEVNQEGAGAPRRSTNPFLKSIV